jgi:hypothetical protein
LTPMALTKLAKPLPMDALRGRSRSNPPILAMPRFGDRPSPTCPSPRNGTEQVDELQAAELWRTAT